MIARVFFKEIAGKRVFYPYGRLGGGYVVKSVQQRRVETLLRRFLMAFALVTIVVAVLHGAALEPEPALVVGIYLAWAVAYAVRIAFLIRRLKVLPIQLADGAIEA